MSELQTTSLDYTPRWNYVGLKMSGIASLGIGKEARFIHKTEKSIIRNREEGSSSIKQAEMRALLHELEISSSFDDWDGYGAKAVRRESLSTASQLIDCLPSNIPIPEIDSTPDGNVIFQWYIKRSYAFTVAIDSSNRLFYAGLFGKNKVDGMEFFDGYLPEQVFNNIRRLFS